jgi:signal peptidase I
MKRIVAIAPTAVVAVLLLLGVWLLFAPAQLGGATRYAVVEGSSMEPGLRRGDLVLVRAGTGRRSAMSSSTEIRRWASRCSTV